MKTSLVIFDLDGTLLDTIGDLAVACNAVLGVRGLPQHTYEEYCHFVGNGILRLVDRALREPLRTPEPVAAVLSFRPGKEANTRTKDVRPCSRVRMFAQNRTENRTESEPKLPATMRIPVLNRARVSSTPSRRVP